MPQRPVFFTAEGDIGRTTYGRQEAESVQLGRFVIIADMKVLYKHRSNAVSDNLLE